MKNIKEFLDSILAGIFIALGGVVFLMVENRYLASFLFSVGLFAVCTLNYNLFTGKVGYFFYNNKKTYSLFLLKVLLANIIGAIFVASLLTLTRNFEILNQKAIEIVMTKINDTYLSLFILAIFCNLFVVFGVEEYKNNPHTIGKYLGLILAVMVFILSGFEHSIADVFYFAMAKIWNPDVIRRIIIIILGNCIGGVIIPSIKLLGK